MIAQISLLCALHIPFSRKFIFCAIAFRDLNLFNRENVQMQLVEIFAFMNKIHMQIPDKILSTNKI